MHEDHCLDDYDKMRTRVNLICHSEKSKVMIEVYGIPVLMLDDLGDGHPHLQKMEIYQIVCPKRP